MLSRRNVDNLATSANDSENRKFNMKIRLVGLSLLAGMTLSIVAAPLTQSTFTDVIKDVNVVTAETKATTPAQVNAVVKAPDLVRTGPASRAELAALDQTITRVGANSVFSFEPKGRELHLEQGSVLFYSPKGKGGGAIKSGGASAAVLGSTMICVAATDGAFETIFLEGKACKVSLKNGKSVILHAGQMVGVLPGQEEFGPVLDIDLGRLAETSLLVSGFSHPLGSLSLIQTAGRDQKKRMAKSGRNQPPTAETVDNNAYSTLTLPSTPRPTGVPPNVNKPQPPGFPR